MQFITITKNTIQKEIHWNAWFFNITSLYKFEGCLVADLIRDCKGYILWLHITEDLPTGFLAWYNQMKYSISYKITSSY